MATLEKIKSISAQDLDINLTYGHYRPLADLINERKLKYAVEIGCAYGNLAEHLLNNTELSRLYSIDPYLAYPDMPGISTQEDYDLLYGYVSKKYEHRHKLVRKTSEDAFPYINSIAYDLEWHRDKFLIFIDGLHTYDAIKFEIGTYGSFLKSGSILSGHDITVFPGVDKAVYEYQKVTGKELFILPGNVWYFEM